MQKQQTIRKSFSLEGKGLHTGLQIRITFHPAPENFGYKIRRVDLPGLPVMDALAHNVSATQRGTVLSLGDIQVSTVEHAMAALYASGIDNCMIDVNAPEFPILDGSSILYINKIHEVGIAKQLEFRKYLTFTEEIAVQDEVTGSSMILLPDDHFNIQLHISFDSPFLKHQYAKLDSLSAFEQDFASARTFVFVREIQPLLGYGLIKGGDLDNAIVIYDREMEQADLDTFADAMGVSRKDATQLGYIMNKPLMYPNEPARHKLLDVIGDLALTGGFIKGRILADCPGHRINNLFAREIQKRALVKTEKEQLLGEPVYQMRAV